MAALPEKALQRLLHNPIGRLSISLMVSCMLHGLLFIFPFDYAKDSDRARKPGASPALRVSLDWKEKAFASQTEFQTETPSLQAHDQLPEPSSSSKLPQDEEESFSEDIPSPLRVPTQDPKADFYTTSELTIKPHPLRDVDLDPASIASIIANGTIELTLRIDRQGGVVDVSIDRSNLPDIFAQTVEKAFRELHFSPGELNGQKVGSIMSIEVRYADERAKLPE